MATIGQLETPKSTVELKFEIEDIELHGIFKIIEKLTGPIFGLMFFQRNRTCVKAPQLSLFYHATQIGGSYILRRNGTRTQPGRYNQIAQ